MGWYILVGVISFLVGMATTALISGKDNVNIGIGNQSITQIYKDGELVEEE